MHTPYRESIQTKMNTKTGCNIESYMNSIFRLWLISLVSLRDANLNLVGSFSIYEFCIYYGVLREQIFKKKMPCKCTKIGHPQHCINTLANTKIKIYAWYLLVLGFPIKISFSGWTPVLGFGLHLKLGS